MKICLLVGTRPEIIKMSPIIKECRRRHSNFFILHTNQHYSANLDRVFFEDLDLPNPKYHLGIGSGMHGEQTGRMLIAIEQILVEERPDLVVLVGDTNTVLAGALAASKLRIKIAHIEAGARSYFRGMPEEINRIVTDHISDFLFTTVMRENIVLRREGVKNNVFCVGNTVADAVHQNLEISKKRSKILASLDLIGGSYLLTTVHRQENVDNKQRLAGILNGLGMVQREFDVPMIYPIHPRTANRVREFKLKVPPEIRLIEPVGYLDFLQLISRARLVLTDSGGAQEESCVLRVPSITLRDNYEWPETLKTGGNMLVGVDPKKILGGAKKMMNASRHWASPFGDGTAAQKIMKTLSKISRDE